MSEYDGLDDPLGRHEAGNADTAGTGEVTPNPSDRGGGGSAGGPPPSPPSADPGGSSEESDDRRGSSVALEEGGGGGGGGGGGDPRSGVQPPAVEAARDPMLRSDRPLPFEKWHPFIVLRNALAKTKKARMNVDVVLVAENNAHRAAHDARLDLEGAQLRAEDTADSSRPLHLSVGYTGVLALSAIDTLPAWWAAEALGNGTTSTALITALLVAALAGFALLLSTFRHDRNRGGFLIATFLSGMLVVLETGLRARYLIVLNGARWSDWLPDVGILALVTAGLVWTSYQVLVRTEPVGAARSRSALNELRQTVAHLDAAARKATAVREKLEQVHRSAYSSLAHLWRGQVEHHPELLDAVEVELNEHSVEAETARRADDLRL